MDGGTVPAATVPLHSRRGDSRLMRVLFVSRKHPPSLGGMQRLSYHLITQMAERVEATAITWGGSQKALPLFIPYALTKSVFLGLRGVDLVHIGDPVLAPIGWVMKRTFRVPVVTTAHGLDITFSLPPYQWTMPRLLRCLDRIVCISQSTVHACVARGIPAGLCVTIHPGVTVPTTLPSREESRQWLERTLNQNLQGVGVLLTVGRLVPRKGVTWFIESVLPRLMASGVKLCYVVVGTGPDEARIRSLTTRLDLGESVHALGQVSEQELSRAYAAADLFVMPNVTHQGDMEGFGLVALEAGAHGVPVVAADLEGISDAVVPGRTGTLVKAEDADLWAATIQELFDDSDKIQQMARLAQVTVQEQFSWTRMVDAYESLFRELLQQRYQVKTGST